MRRRRLHNERPNPSLGPSTLKPRHLGEELPADMEPNSEPSIARTNSNLSDLSSGPPYRGALEKVDTLAIRGWCLGAAHPTRPVALSVQCEGVLLGKTQTQALRKELSRQLGTPVHAGFVFHWTEASSRARTALIERLSTLGDTSTPVFLRLLVEDPEAPTELETAWALDQGVPSRADLLTYLKSKTTSSPQTFIAQRESLLRSLPAPRSPTSVPRVRTLAFYLPQFHPIPENDEWWGTGFTEWTNVSTARPLFEGHDQPRIPSDLGYYDLRTPGILEQQIELARSHGLAGFCFHHYWFSGRRLLEMPLQRFLEIDHDFGFCICWANEPWSRRWDGSEKEVLVPQDHSFDSDIAFIHDALPLLKDRRYIRVGGKPILIVYRVGLIKEAVKVFERWRRICVEHGLPGLHICMAESFNATDPQLHGCDSSVEFPPHNLVAQQLTEIPGRVLGLDPQFGGKIYEYAEVVAHELTRADPDYPRYSTLMGGWDNTSRRGLNAHVCTGFSLEVFELWLEHACERAERLFREEDRLVFINAWNEWGEGTYLEPDRRYGRALLQTVRNVLHSATSTTTTAELLRRRLADDAAALAAVDRLQGRIKGLERALEEAMAMNRRSTPRGLCSVTSPIEPRGLTPMRAGGNGAVERLGASDQARSAVLRRGDFLYLSGWAIPADRRLGVNSVCFLKLAPASQASSHFAYQVRRLAREDIATESSLHRSKTFWSGFVFNVSTAQLPAAHYELSLIFPAEGSDIGCAVEIGLDRRIEIVG